MNPGSVAAISVVIISQLYFLASEARTTILTTHGQDNSADKGTLTRIWVYIALALAGAWVIAILSPGRILAPGGWLTWAGIAVMISGLAFRRYVISFLGRYFTATIQIRQNHELVTTGPYSKIRHPSYLGILVFTVGSGISMANWISLLLCFILPTIGIIRRIRVEEKRMLRHFGQRYQDYMQSTRHIIPYIY